MGDFYGAALDTTSMPGTARYPSPAAPEAAFRASGASVATVSLRREAGRTLRAHSPAEIALLSLTH